MLCCRQYIPFIYRTQFFETILKYRGCVLVLDRPLLSEGFVDASAIDRSQLVAPVTIVQGPPEMIREDPR